MNHEARLRRIEDALAAATRSAEPTLAEIVQAAYAMGGCGHPVSEAPAPTIRIERPRSLRELILSAGQPTPNDAEDSE